MSIFPPYYELAYRLRVGEMDLEGRHDSGVHSAREGRPPVNNNDFDLSFFEHSLDTIGLSLWIIKKIENRARWISEPGQKVNLRTVRCSINVCPGVFLSDEFDELSVYTIVEFVHSEAASLHGKEAVGPIREDNSS